VNCAYLDLELQMAQMTVPTPKPKRASGILMIGQNNRPPMPRVSIKTKGTRQPPTAAPPQPNFHHGLSALPKGGGRFGGNSSNRIEQSKAEANSQVFVRLLSPFPSPRPSRSCQTRRGELKTGHVQRSSLPSSRLFTFHGLIGRRFRKSTALLILWLGRSARSQCRSTWFRLLCGVFAVFLCRLPRRLPTH
jgi:hypothetical protein